MKKALELYIKQMVKKPKEIEIDEILETFTVKEFRKGTFFKKPFSKSKELGFVVNGALRLVLYKKNGEEVTARLLQKNMFVADVFSIRNNESTPLGIQTLEHTSMLVADYEKIQDLLNSNLSLNIVLREYITERAAEMGKNYLLFITGNAKERYQFILENNPKLLEKFPLRFIASMIGITPTQLSRIRNEKIE